MKYIVLLAVILTAINFFLFSRVNTLEKDKTTLEGEKKALITSIERYKNAEVEANRTIKRLRQISQTNKTNLDWYHGIIPDEFVKLLQERHNRTVH